MINVAYRGSHNGKDTQRSVSGSWVFGWGRLHDSRRGIVAKEGFKNRVRLKNTAPRLCGTFSFREGIMGGTLTYRLVSTDFWVVLDISFNILSPDDRVIIG
jgi:hypothetical protein